MDKVPVSISELYRVEDFLRGLKVGKFVFQSVGLNLTQTSWLVEFQSPGCIYPGVEKDFISHITRRLSEQYPKNYFEFLEEKSTVYIVGRITRTNSIEDLSQPPQEIQFDDDSCYISESDKYLTIIRADLNVYEDSDYYSDALIAYGQACIVNDFGLDSPQYTAVCDMFPDQVNKEVQNFETASVCQEKEVSSETLTFEVSQAFSSLIYALKEQTDVLTKLLRNNDGHNNSSNRNHTFNSKIQCNSINRSSQYDNYYFSTQPRYGLGFNSPCSVGDDWVIERNRSYNRHVFTTHSSALKPDEIKAFSRKKRNAYYALQRIKYKKSKTATVNAAEVSAINSESKPSFNSVPPPNYEANIISHKINKSKLTSDVLTALSVIMKCDGKSTRYHSSAVRELLRADLPIAEFGLDKVLNVLESLGFGRDIIKDHGTLAHLQRFAVGSSMESPHRFCRK